MSITDELREWAKGSMLSSWMAEHLTAIADHIDAEHEEALREAYTKGCEDGMGVANKADMRAEYLRGKNDGYDEGWDAGFASADDWCAQHESEMAEHGWIRLPKDADGEPIHVGDKLIDEDDKLQKPAIVKCILYNDEGCVVSDIDPRGCWYDPSLLRHHHKPTVEDVLTKMLEKAVGYSDAHTTVASNAIAECAPKLRLAEGEDA